MVPCIPSREVSPAVRMLTMTRRRDPRCMNRFGRSQRPCGPPPRARCPHPAPLLLLSPSPPPLLHCMQGVCVVRGSPARCAHRGGPAPADAPQCHPSAGEGGGEEKEEGGMRVSVGALPQEMHRSATLVQVCVCWGDIPTANAGGRGTLRGAFPSDLLKKLMS